MTRIIAILLAATSLAACVAGPRPADAVSGVASMPASVGESRAFWDHLQALCGNAYEGAGIHVPPTDTAFVGARMVMHVTECSDTLMRIPFHVGDDRSRTWVLRRAGGNLELKHIHRHEDGTASSNTNYGGTTAARGTPHRQEFPADSFSVAAVPGRASQFWFLEHYPGHRFAYGLFREGTGLHYRIEFDLTRTVPAPPPAW
ncbi:MAG TPA: hypothetical protein VK929_10455 [Longimicrobiales bacterium]|nr:hypothetical protein [Longimicrobiales bacterium]